MFTDVVDMSTDVVDMFTDVVDMFTDVVDMSADVVDMFTDVVDMFTDVVDTSASSRPPERVRSARLCWHRRRKLLPASRAQAPESTVGQPMAVCQQGIYVEYSVEYSKCRALNGILVSTVDDWRLLN
eukprot:1048344-Pyramimonas_sp.AAC.1